MLPLGILFVIGVVLLLLWFVLFGGHTELRVRSGDSMRMVFFDMELEEGNRTDHLVLHGQPTPYVRQLKRRPFRGRFVPQEEAQLIVELRGPGLWYALGRARDPIQIESRLLGSRVFVAPNVSATREP